MSGAIRKEFLDDGEARETVIPIRRTPRRSAVGDDLIQGMIQEAIDSLVRAQTVLRLSRERDNRKP